MEKNEFKDFASVALSTYNVEKLDLNLDSPLEALLDEIASAFNDLNSEATKKARFDFFNLPNTTPNDYTEYIVTIPDKGRVICGIRHLSAQKEKPFLQILTSFKASKEELKTIYENFLSDKFKVFNPRYLQFYTSCAIESDKTGAAYLVQKASVIKGNLKFEIEDAIELNAPKSEQYYDWYEYEYRMFHTKNPSLAHKVPLNSKSLMEESRKAGLLKEVIYKDEVIGLIAALSSNFLGEKGKYFIEILLRENWKNKGFAKAIQRKFVSEYVHEDEIVWGTIDVNNIPSFNTALANLRVPIRYENFVKID